MTPSSFRVTFSILAAHAAHVMPDILSEIVVSAPDLGFAAGFCTVSLSSSITTGHIWALSWTFDSGSGIVFSPTSYPASVTAFFIAVSYTHLTLPTNREV